MSDAQAGIQLIAISSPCVVGEQTWVALFVQRSSYIRTHYNALAVGQLPPVVRRVSRMSAGSDTRACNTRRLSKTSQSQIDPPAEKACGRCRPRHSRGGAAVRLRLVRALRYCRSTVVFGLVLGLWLQLAQCFARELRNLVLVRGLATSTPAFNPCKRHASRSTHSHA